MAVPGNFSLKMHDASPGQWNMKSGIRVVPKHSGWWWEPSTKLWATKWRSGRPVSRVSQLAAMEYAAWRSRSSDRWLFKLPDDGQWEKAARGADRRIYVWGNYLIANFFWSYNAFSDPKSNKHVTGNVFSTDESVYGIRDLAGSLREFTRSKALPRYNYVSLRGGNFRTTDEYESRIATRNGLPPDEADIRVGIRLIAIPKNNGPQ